ncbi:MAG: hypothetical protein Q9162_007918, partial [Coniocarpon cinnabarinum]
MSSQSRRDEILLKKQRLAELKKQREQRSRDFEAGRQSIGGPDTRSPAREEKTTSRKDLDTLIDKLVGEDRVGSPAPSTPPSARVARPSSYASPFRQSLEGAEGEAQTAADGDAYAARPPQTLSFAPLKTLYEIASDPPKKEVITYSKGVQTGDEWITRPRTPSSGSDSDRDTRPGTSDGLTPRRKGRRKREREEDIRQQLRAEIEEEVRTAQQQPDALGISNKTLKETFPSRALTTEEVEAVTSSVDFLDFVDRSSKVIERALDEEYDVLADYRYGTTTLSDESASDDENDSIPARGRRGTSRKGRRLKEVHQFHDEKWSRRRIISDVAFSPKFPELLLASYTKNPSEPYSPSGVCQVWNLHMHARPEYVFHATSDILTATFSPFHPNLLLGGTYSGQVLLWDTRARSHDPVQRTPLTGMGTGHTHPVYALKV